MNPKRILVFFCLTANSEAAPKWIVSFPDLVIGNDFVGHHTQGDYFFDSSWGIGLNHQSHVVRFGLFGGSDLIRQGEALSLNYRPIHKPHFTLDGQIGFGISNESETQATAKDAPPGWSKWGPLLRLESSAILWHRFVGLRIHVFGDFYDPKWDVCGDYGIGLGMVWGR